MSTNNYNDIINLPHHVSLSRPQMSMHDRAAQFSPFAALTGYGAKIKETARLTGEKLELDESTAERIDTCLQILIDNADERPEISVTYFVPDERKAGGEYITASGNFRRFDESNQSIVFTDGRKIAVGDIGSIDGEIFATVNSENL